MNDTIMERRQGIRNGDGDNYTISEEDNQWNKLALKWRRTSTQTDNLDPATVPPSRLTQVTLPHNGAILRKDQPPHSR